MNNDLGSDSPRRPHRQVVVILDNVRSASNVGSIFRTCDAFGVEKLLLCGITALPPNREILKTALGATEFVLWQHYPSVQAAVNDMINEGYLIVLVEQLKSSVHPTSLREAKRPICLVFGNEVTGVSPQLQTYADLAVEIPQVGQKKSLNVSVAAGVVLWEVVR